jgi:hypothetical protein
MVLIYMTASLQSSGGSERIHLRTGEFASSADKRSRPSWRRGVLSPLGRVIVVGCTLLSCGGMVRPAAGVGRVNHPRAASSRRPANGGIAEVAWSSLNAVAAIRCPRWACSRQPARQAVTPPALPSTAPSVAAISSLCPPAPTRPRSGPNGLTIWAAGPRGSPRRYV